MNYVYLSLLILAMVSIELLIGGTRLLFSIPSYGTISLAAMATVISFRRNLLPASLACLGSAVLFFGYILFRALTSPVEYLARADLYMVLAALMTYFLVAWYLIATKHRVWIVLALLALSQMHVIVGLMQFLRGETFTLFGLMDVSEYGTRARGFYICPNHLAGFLEVVALLGLGVACWSRSPAWMKLTTGYMSLVCLAGIMMTGSRGGYLSTLTGLTVFIILNLIAIRQRLSDRFRLALGGSILLGILLAVGFTMTLNRHVSMQTRVAKIADMNDLRVDLWRAALQQSQLQPWTGTGSGTYQYYGRQFRSPRTQADPVYVHNDYLQLYAEYGLLGAIGFLLFFVIHGWIGARTFRWCVTERGRVRSDSLALSIGALSALSAYLVHSFFDFNLHIPANTLLLAMVFGFIANPGANNIPFADFSFPRINRWLRLGLPALGVWFIAAGLPTFPAERLTEKSRVAMRDQDYTNAVVFAEQAIQKDPRNVSAFQYLGQAHSFIAETLTNQTESVQAYIQSEKALLRAVALYPQDRWTHLFLGWSLDGQKRYEEATAYFAKAVELDPNSFQVYVYYGNHLRLLGRREEARTAYEKSLKLVWNQAALYGLEALKHEAANAPTPVSALR